MFRNLLLSFSLLPILALHELKAAEGPQEPQHGLVKEFEGTYRFNYLFVENGIPYLDLSSHLQLLQAGKNQNDSAPRILFFNQSSKGEKRPHYSYAFYQRDGKLILREFDGKGNFRFDCVGTYQAEKKILECVTPHAPKPARDVDSPVTRQSGLFKRPTSWPSYETLQRHNIFRFYDWGFLYLQENLKLDASGKIVAHESGAVTALRIHPQEP